MMNKTKKIYYLFFCAIVLILSSCLNAQAQEDSTFSVCHTRAVKEAAAIKKTLGLSEIQHTKLELSLEYFYRQMTRIHLATDFAGSRKAYLSSVYQERESRVMAILDSAQRKAYLQHMEERRMQVLNNPALKNVRKSFITE